MSESSRSSAPIIEEVRIKMENDIVELDSDDDICELEHLRKLFIGGLAPYTTEASLKEFYGKWGKVVDCVVMRDPLTRRSRGFGFITYTKSSSVNRAQENRPHVIDGKAVEAKRALQRPDRENREANLSVRKLFVGGLKDCHNEDNLKEYFSRFGNVVSVKLLSDKTTGKRRGFAFVEYDDYDSVDKAILKKSHIINMVIVDVKKSVYKEELKKRQELMANNSIDGIKKQVQRPGVMNGGQFNGNHMQKPPQQMPYPQPVPAANGPLQVPPQGPPQVPPQGPPQAPPPSYNYWGPPPPHVQQPYGGAYQYPPPQPPMNNWNYPQAPPNWNGPPPAAATWPPNQWGYGPPPVQAPAAGPPPAWNGPPAPPGQQVPPPGTQTAMPPTQAQPVAPGAAAPPNFGTGYQQNYGGGPVKGSPPNTNRMNPYNSPPSNPGNPFATNGVGYKKVIPTATPVAPVGGGASYRR